MLMYIVCIGLSFVNMWSIIYNGCLRYAAFVSATVDIKVLTVIKVNSSFIFMFFVNILKIKLF